MLKGMLLVINMGEVKGERMQDERGKGGGCDSPTCMVT